MKYKILFTGGRKEWIQQFAEPSTTIDIAPRDPEGVYTPHLEYEFYEHIAIHRTMRMAVRAEKNGYDALVIGCFYDPGLRESRELVEMPIIVVQVAHTIVRMALIALVSLEPFAECC